MAAFSTTLLDLNGFLSRVQTQVFASGALKQKTIILSKKFNAADDTQAAINTNASGETFLVIRTSGKRKFDNE